MNYNIQAVKTHDEQTVTHVVPWKKETHQKYLVTTDWSTLRSYNHFALCTNDQFTHSYVASSESDMSDKDPAPVQTVQFRRIKWVRKINQSLIMPNWNAYVRI